MATRRRRSAIFWGNSSSNPFTDEFLRYAEAKKARDQKKSKGFHETIFGGMGSGKSYVSALEASMTKQNDSNITLTASAPLTGIQESRGYAIVNHNNEIDYPTTNTPINISSPWSNQTTASQVANWIKPSETVHPQKQESKKQEFSPEDHKGKFCAVVTMTITQAGITLEHTGVLFVKKCGHWKLMDFNGDKLGGGTAGSFEGDIRKGRIKIEVHKILYDVDYVKPEIGVDELEIL